MTGLVIRQSDLASYQWCAQQVHLREKAKAEGWHEPILSATAGGTVFHYAAQVLQKLHHEGREDALDVALATFARYWDPNHIGEISEGPVDVWIAQDTWGGMQARHQANLRAMYAWLKKERSVLLSLEHTFDVPIVIDGEEHTLHGTVDRLALRMVNARPVLAIEDFKTYRRKPEALDWNTQMTLYSFASLDPQFWTPFFENEVVLEGFSEVLDRLDARGLALWGDSDNVIPRRGRILRAWDGFNVHEAGWRTEAHYARLKAHLREYIKARRAGVYPLTVDSHHCRFCPFNNGICGDAPLPERQLDIDG